MYIQPIDGEDSIVADKRFGSSRSVREGVMVEKQGREQIRRK